MKTRASLLALSAALAAGCNGGLPAVWITDMPIRQPKVRIEPGDQITVSIKGQENLSGTFEVRPNGTYAQPVIGDLPVAGLTEDEVAAQLPGLLEGIVVDPQVSVSIAQRKPIEIPVLGEVQTVGVVSVPKGTRLVDILAQAGGLTQFASKSGIYVLRREPKLIRIRFDYDALVGGEPHHSSFQLQEGDVVVIK